MIAFGYEATGLATDDVFVYTLDKTGKVTREVRIKAAVRQFDPRHRR